MRRKFKKEKVEEVKVEVAVIEEKTNPLALRYINLCHEKGLNGLDSSKLSDTELKVLIKHLTR